MFKTIILICALSTARPDCSVDTAVSVIQGPEASHLAQCGFIGQAYVAGTAMASYLDGEHYLKMLCSAGDQLDVHKSPDQATQQRAAATP